MTQLNLEFIYRRQVPWIGFAFLAIALGYGASVAINWLDLHSMVEHGQERILKSSQSLKDKQRLALINQNNSEPGDEQRKKNEKKMMMALTYPWNRVLSTIEQSAEKDVAILSFVHRQSISDTQLSVEALDVPALIRFVEKMNEDEGSRWYITGYQMQAQNTPQTVKANISNK